MTDDCDRMQSINSNVRKKLRETDAAVQNEAAVTSDIYATRNEVNK